MSEYTWSHKKIDELIKACPEKYYSMEIYLDEYPIHDDLLVFSTSKEDEENTVDKMALYNEIHEWIIHDWLPKNEPLPINKKIKWATIYSDMSVLSRRFPDVTFVVYEKDLVYIDNISMKIFKNGGLIGSSTEVKMVIQLITPDKRYINVNKKGELELNESVRFYENKTRDFGEMAEVASDIFMATASLAIGVGSAISHTSTIFSLCTVAITTANNINTVVQNVRWNVRKCNSLAERCNRISNTIQKIDPKYMDIDFIKYIIKTLDECLKLVIKHGNRWWVTKIVASSAAKNEFEQINEKLSEIWWDFGVSVDIATKFN